MFSIFKKIVLLIILLFVNEQLATSQNLVAAQMNIYFGHPKTVIQNNSQGTIVTTFDYEGRILSISQGNMRMDYDWANDGKSVIVSMYQGADIKDSVAISISEMSNKKLKYNIGDIVNFEISFKSNGAVEHCVNSNPQMTVTTDYYYKNIDDFYPYSYEMYMGDQSIKISLIIDKMDSIGNAIEYTQELMGQKDSSRLEIEYY